LLMAISLMFIIRSLINRVYSLNCSRLTKSVLVSIIKGLIL